MSIEELKQLDREDPLAHLRERFVLAEDGVYLDGNSLGALSVGVQQRVRQVLDQQWGQDLIASWNRHDWINMPRTVGEKIAPLLGASPGQVICCDSISVNLFKLLCTALALRPGRTLVLSQQDNFPTDLYAAEGVVELLGPGRCELRTLPEDELEAGLDENVAVLMLTHVNFRNGRLHDMGALTAAAHKQGALVLWDLAHSAGVLPLSLDEWGVDLAVGCGYKFLNGGPGAPAFLYLAKRHQNQVAQPLSGWMGHGSAFDFDPAYAPAAGVGRYLSGTPGILGMSALDAALDLFAGVTVQQLRDKSLALTARFIAEFDAAPALKDFELVSPRQPQWRGSQVSLAHPEAYAISQALIAAGVIVDFRAPDIVRFGFSPMYNRYLDVALSISELSSIMQDRRYLEPRFFVRATVT